MEKTTSLDCLIDVFGKDFIDKAFKEYLKERDIIFDERWSLYLDKINHYLKERDIKNSKEFFGFVYGFAGKNIPKHVTSFWIRNEDEKAIGYALGITAYKRKIHELGSPNQT